MLDTLDLSKINKVHFVGINSGFSSFCAKKLMDMGKIVTASEFNQENEVAEEWIRKGVLYKGGHNADFIKEDLDLAVFPNGIIPGNPECERAIELKIPTINVGELVGILTSNLKTIAIAGTHGKTTTSALCVWLLKELVGEPNFIIGDKIAGLAHNQVGGSEESRDWGVNPKSEYFVVEACEYKRQFLKRAPDPYISVITHIDFDHSDYYKDQADYNSAFVEFIGNTKSRVLISLDGRNETGVIARLKSRGFKPKVENVEEYRAELNGLTFPLIGRCNRENVLRAYVLGISLGFARDRVIKALQSFKGVANRFEFVGRSAKGNLIYKDYAHNPAKIRAAIEAVKETFEGRKLVLVWEPHSHERSYTFRNEFAEAIKDADTTFLVDIFSPARETEKQRNLISSHEFYKVLESVNRGRVIYAGNYENTLKLIKEFEHKKDDNIGNYVFLFASAGKLYKVVEGMEIEGTYEIIV